MSTGPQFDDSKRLTSEQVLPVRSATAARRTARRSRRTAMLVIVSLVAIAVVSAVLWSRRNPPSQPIPVRLSLGLPPGVTLQRNWHPFEQMVVSPDGEMLAFSATDASGQSSLWIRPLGSA